VTDISSDMIGLFALTQQTKSTAETINLNINKARLATMHAIARHVWNIVTQDFTGSFQSSPIPFVDGAFFLMKGSPVPVPDLAPPKTLEMCSPQFKDFSILYSALCAPFTATSYETASYDSFLNIFRNIFKVWLGLEVNIPIGSEVGSPVAVASPNLFYLIDPTQLHRIKYPKATQLASTVYSGSLVSLPYSLTYKSLNTPVRPFYGSTLKAIWSPTIAETCASQVSSEVMASGALIKDPITGMKNTWNIFTRVLIQALNTATIIPSSYSTQIYGLPTCQSSAPALVSGKINWSVL